jgi:hypothetical protein
MSLLIAPQFLGPRASPTLLQVLTALSLTTNLKLCLDAADPLSYPGAGQDWLDRSGAGNADEFHRGTDATVAADDPTFAGDHFSFDGGDEFEYGAANEAWMDSFHKDNALLSMLFAFQVGALGASQALMGTNLGGGTFSGINVIVNADGTVNFLNPEERNVSNVNAISAATWYLGCVSVNEATATGLLRFNKTDFAFDGSYNSPKAGAADSTMSIGSRGGASLKLSAGSKLAAVAMWSGTALTSANFQSIEAAFGPRFGI